MKGVLRGIRRVVTRLRFNRHYGNYPGTLAVTREGLQLTQYVVRDGAIVQEPAWSFPWTEVTSAWAFKRDLFAVDQICVEFRLGDGRVMVTCEDMPGFDALAETLPHALPGMDKSWWQKVAFPAFATNATLIWSGAPEQ